MRGSRTIVKLSLLSAIVVMASLMSTGGAWAQGCVLIRQHAPVFGMNGEALPEPGDLEFSVSYRGLHADDHYNGTIRQPQRQELGTYVVNNQQEIDFYGSYAVTKRLSFAMSVPYVDASWSVP